MKKILYIEDDLNLASSIKSSLIHFRMIVEHFSNCEKALQIFDKFRPDIIFINIVLNDKRINGFNFSEIIREKSSVPILVTTPVDDDLHLHKIFDIKNSDYIRKPYGVTEMKLRINKMLYPSVTTHIPGDIYQLGNTCFIPCGQSLQIEDKEIHLSQFETDVLAILCKNMSQFIHHDTIIHHVWHINDCKMKEPSYYNVITKLRRLLKTEPRVRIESKMKSMVRIHIQ